MPSCCQESSRLLLRCLVQALAFLEPPGIIGSWPSISFLRVAQPLPVTPGRKQRGSVHGSVCEPLCWLCRTMGAQSDINELRSYT